MITSFNRTRTGQKTLFTTFITDQEYDWVNIDLSVRLRIYLHNWLIKPMNCSRDVMRFAWCSCSWAYWFFRVQHGCISLKHNGSTGAERWPAYWYGERRKENAFNSMPLFRGWQSILAKLCVLARGRECYSVSHVNVCLCGSRALCLSRSLRVSVCVYETGMIAVNMRLLGIGQE